MWKYKNCEIDINRNNYIRQMNITKKKKTTKYRFSIHENKNASFYSLKKWMYVLCASSIRSAFQHWSVGTDCHVKMFHTPFAKQIRKICDCAGGDWHHNISNDIFTLIFIAYDLYKSYKSIPKPYHNSFDNVFAFVYCLTNRFVVRIFFLSAVFFLMSRN